ncbi:MAG: histidinol-phosphate aminotransferase family protein, partial [Thermoprotei archaeon]
VIESFDGIVVVDEAYAEYARYSILNEATERDNLVVIRTFSKAWGLAGMRVGYLVTNKRLASELRARGRVFACSSLSLKAALLMLEHWEDVRKAIEELKAVREWMRMELIKAGVKAYPSDANFLLVRLPVDSRRVCARLLEEGIAVKDVSSFPLCDNCIRVTVPPKPAAETFINTLKSVLEQNVS